MDPQLPRAKEAAFISLGWWRPFLCRREAPDSSLVRRLRSGNDPGDVRIDVGRRLRPGRLLALSLQALRFLLPLPILSRQLFLTLGSAWVGHAMVISVQGSTGFAETSPRPQV